MEFVLGVLVAFILASYVWPQAVRSRPHFVLAVPAVLLALTFGALAVLFAGAKFIGPPFSFLSSLLDIVTFLLLVRAASGLTVGQWVREIGNALTGLGPVK